MKINNYLFIYLFSSGTSYEIDVQYDDDDYANNNSNNAFFGDLNHGVNSNAIADNGNHIPNNQATSSNAINIPGLNDIDLNSLPCTVVL